MSGETSGLPRAGPPARSFRYGRWAPVGCASMPEAVAHPDLPSRWPAAVRAELERRNSVLREHAAGRVVVDLSRPSERDALMLSDGSGLRDSEGSLNSVVSVCGLVHCADLPGTLASLGRLVGPGGELLALEPVGRPGITGMVASSIGALLPAVRNVHLARDLPAALRSTGWTLTDLERFTMPTLIWPLRPFVQLRALRLEGRGS